MSHDLRYDAGPTASRFHKSDAFVRGIMGPVGSGKSVACCWEIYMRAIAQEPNWEKVRKSRVLIVRNTLPQLETTTMKTWKDWFPAGNVNNPGTFGILTRKPPFTHYMKMALPDGTRLDLEVQFIALDKSEDVRKLLSYECSGVWINEAREIQKEIIDAATARVGRFPGPKDGGCTRPYIIMDTNPPNDTHWWFHVAEEQCPKTWEFFRQPSGLSPYAENLENLLQPSNHKKLTTDARRKHGRLYYERMLGGKTEEWINVYIHGQYGYIETGQKVYGKSWNRDVHVAKHPIKTNPNAVIHIGIDASGRHPAAIFAQQSSRGQWQLLHEIFVKEKEGMNATHFSQVLKNVIKTKYPGNITEIWGDPAGQFKSYTDERNYFDILRGHGIAVKAAPVPNNNIEVRLSTVNNVLDKMIDGEPAIIVSPTCKQLISGFDGGYQFKKLNVSGEERYDTRPNKNRYSDIHDSLQYMLCGSGEMQEIYGRNRRSQKVVYMDTRFKM